MKEELKKAYVYIAGSVRTEYMQINQIELIYSAFALEILILSSICMPVISIGYEPGRGF